MRAFAALALLVALPGAGAAQTAIVTTQANPAIRSRADEVVAILTGGGDYAATFSAIFRQAVPRPQFDGIATSLAATLGPARRIDAVTPTGPWSATLVIGFERGTATAQIVLDPAPPHVVNGLRITGTNTRDDSLARIEADARALPGAVGLGVYELGGAAPRPLLAIDDTRAMPLASAFKLWVLADLVREIRAGRRRWAEVVPVGAPSLPSGVLQSWPAAAPITVQTLATQMISISDNTAADTLIHLIGRRRVDADAAAAGLAPPLLTTREAFALKADAALTRRWREADVAGRRALLAREEARIAAAPLDATIFAGGPVATDSVEWFASPRATAGLLDWLRREGDATTHAILAVNPGADPATSARFAYLGYKGGSEPGVLTLNFLARTRDGRWFAVVGAWHRPDGITDEPRFVALLTRALALIAPQKR